METNCEGCPSIAAIATGMKSWAWRAICIALFTSLPLVTTASNGEPIVRAGNVCPSGYKKDGEYCIPRAGIESTPAAVEKKGTCPAGYRKNGDYCIAQAGTRDTPHLIEKKGTCPAGYRTSGEYCREQGH